MFYNFYNLIIVKYIKKYNLFKSFKMKTILICFIIFILNKINCAFPFFNILYENGSIANLRTTTHTTYIYGHKNPDTDAISAAIVLADYQKKIGNKNNIVACRLGKLNKETKYVLNFFKINAPILIQDLSGADEVILVDHNSPSQTLDFENANIVGLIDHHAITGFETTNPIEIITKPVGCTCTILYELYKQNNITISYEMAGLMISAIISDTLLLQSSITTQQDIDTVNELSHLIGLDYKAYGQSMLLAGTDVSDLSESEIINFDSKAYNVNGYMIQIAFVNSADVSELLIRKQKLLEEINKFIEKNNVKLFVLTIVDIIEMDSTILVSGSLSKVVETAFNVEIQDNEAFLKGITSRKKEVYPKIANVINELPEYINDKNGQYKIHLNFFILILWFLVF